jgi:hypothetical protein
MEKNKSMLQFRENLKIKKMIKYGSRSRSSSRKRLQGVSGINVSNSTSNLIKPIGNFRKKAEEPAKPKILQK